MTDKRLHIEQSDHLTGAGEEWTVSASCSRATAIIHPLVKTVYGVPKQTFQPPPFAIGSSLELNRGGRQRTAGSSLRRLLFTSIVPCYNSLEMVLCQYQIFFLFFILLRAACWGPRSGFDPRTRHVILG